MPRLERRVHGGSLQALACDKCCPKLVGCKSDSRADRSERAGPAPTSLAVPIEGTIGFSGLGSVTAGATTTVNFSNPLHTIDGSDDYSVVPFGTPVTFQSIAYVGTGGDATLTAPVTPLWTFNLATTTYSFDLTNLTSATKTSGGGLSSLTLAGLGTAFITGFEPTQGSFAIQGTGRNLSLQFVSASTTANGTAVPDGGMTVAFLGLAWPSLG
jgi:hypothetical protein